MKEWFRGKWGGAAAFVVICGLVAGGLGWVTAAALRLEDEQLAAHAESAREELIRQALWRLDSYVAPQLAVEAGRPFNHYSAVFAAWGVQRGADGEQRPGVVVEPSPLVNPDVPAWMLLHFQLDAASGWESPQAPSAHISRVLLDTPIATTLPSSPERTAILDELKRSLPPGELITAVRDRVSQETHGDSFLAPPQRPNADNRRNNDLLNNTAQAPANDFELRQQTTQFNPNQSAQLLDRSVAINSLENNGANWLNYQAPLGAPRKEVLVNVSPMAALWMPTEGGHERLLLVRLVDIDESAGRKKVVCQGIVLDDDALRGLLTDKIADLFPQARLLPVHEPRPPRPERAMTAAAVPARPWPDGVGANPGWTPLRVGLVLAWAAALVALAAVGLGGRALLNLSERRIRFVSAVTHELRTPLTTLRLYLDMLMNGLVRDEKQREEYIATLHAEAERLNRLVGNVLDFSRLEKQRPRLNRTREARLPTCSRRAAAVWQGRCRDADKEMVIEEAAPAALCTDGELVQQILGNLLDNACKYSRGAADRRVRLRARRQGRRVQFEVEDGGPGVPKGERRMIFRPFRRGRDADAAATGGVGLGLALARSWARLLGGDLTLLPTAAGACFRLSLPTGHAPTTTHPPIPTPPASESPPDSPPGRGSRSTGRRPATSSPSPPPRRAPPIALSTRPASARARRARSGPAPASRGTGRHRPEA